MKKSTKWILGTIGTVLVIIFIVCSGMLFIFFKNNGDKGYDKKQKEVQDIADFVLLNTSGDPKEKEAFNECALSIADDISNEKKGRNAMVDYEIVHVDSEDAENDFEQIKDKLTELGFKGEVEQSSSSYSQITDFYGESQDGSIDLALNLYDYTQSPSASGALINLTLRSQACYRD